MKRYKTANTSLKKIATTSLKIYRGSSIIFATDICYQRKNHASWQNSAGLALT